MRMPVMKIGPEISGTLVAVLLCLATPLTAQPPVARARPNIPFCIDSTSEPYRQRVLLELTYDGANRREMWNAIVMAVEQAGTCVATRGDASPPADTSVYGRLRINVVGDGGYEVATELAGPRARRNVCDSERAAIITGNFPILWGTLLSGSVRYFVQCLLRTRGRVS